MCFCMADGFHSVDLRKAVGAGLLDEAGGQVDGSHHEGSEFVDWHSCLLF